MKTQPHAIFTRKRYGVYYVIEINSGRATGKINGKPSYESIRITRGIQPGWMYKATGEDSIWHDEYICSYVGGKNTTYIDLLRMVVAWKTSLPDIACPQLCLGKPKLGFHSSYRSMKRAAA